MKLSCLSLTHFQFQSLAELIIIPLMEFQLNHILQLVKFHLDCASLPSLARPNSDQCLHHSASQWVSALSAYHILLGRFKDTPVRGP